MRRVSRGSAIRGEAVISIGRGNERDLRSEDDRTFYGEALSDEPLPTRRRKLARTGRVPESAAAGLCTHGFDDRRYPAENCLDALGPKKLTPAELWKVMSATPTRNAMTTFTQILLPKTGHFESYKQNCVPGPTCAPF